MKPKSVLLSVVFLLYDVEKAKDKVLEKTVEMKDRLDAELGLRQALDVGIVHWVGTVEHHVPSHRVLQVTIQEVHAQETPLPAE